MSEEHEHEAAAVALTGWIADLGAGGEDAVVLADGSHVATAPGHVSVEAGWVRIAPSDPRRPTLVLPATDVLAVVLASGVGSST